MPKTSKLSSIPRRHVLWLLLTLLIGWLVNSWLNADEIKSFDQVAWGSFASVVSGAAASMVSLTVALTAIIYALLGTPLIKFLHERGALNRILFDLMAGAAIWLTALVSSIIAAHPNSARPDIWMQIATSCAISGSVHFIAIGSAFWLLLRSSDTNANVAMLHDFRKPTDLGESIKLKNSSSKS